MNKQIMLLLSMCLCSLELLAQTPVKEATNNFARYTQKPDFGTLEKARKNIDEAYKTRKDSSSYKVNLIRGLIYSTLAYADSNRRLAYVNEPIKEAASSLEKLKNPKLNDLHEGEIQFIKQQLARAWSVKAGKYLKSYNYESAFDAFIWIDSLSHDKYLAKHNLAVLSERLGRYDKALYYYNQLIADKKKTLPDHYLALANLYENSRNSSKALAVIEDGRKAFPANKDLLFKAINLYADNGSYEVVAKLIADALQLAPENLNLLYLAGFSFESIGKGDKAENYYKKLIEIEENNYEGNYALGLLYLNRYLQAKEKNKDLLTDSRRYLVQAGEINPNAVNVLKSLSILYSLSGNAYELQRVKNKLNQIILN